MSTPVFHNRGTKPNLQMCQNSLYSSARERTKSGRRKKRQVFLQTHWNIRKNKKRLWTRWGSKKKAAAGVAVAALKGSSVDLVCSRGGRRAVAQQRSLQLQSNDLGKVNDARHLMVIPMCFSFAWYPGCPHCQLHKSSPALPLFCLHCFGEQNFRTAVFYSFMFSCCGGRQN